MTCKKCGNIVDDNAKFCPYCGENMQTNGALNPIQESNQEVQNVPIEQPVEVNNVEINTASYIQEDNLKQQQSQNNVNNGFNQNQNFEQPQYTQQPTLQPVQNQPQLNTQQSLKNKNIKLIVIISIIVVVCILSVIVLLTSTKNKNKDIDIDSNVNSVEEDNNLNSDKTIIQGSKNTLNLIVAGNVDSGREDVISLLTKIYGEEESSDKVSMCHEEIEAGVVYNYTERVIKDNNRNYNIYYMCGIASAVKYTIKNADLIDGSILVINTSDGIAPQTREYLKLLDLAGTAKTIVYINDDSDLDYDLTLLKSDIVELLNDYNFDGNNTPIIVSSKGKIDEKSIKELMTSLYNWIETPQSDEEKDFLMPIEDVFTISGRGTVVTGRVERGQLKLNDEVEIVGLKETKKTVVTGIEMFRKSLDYAESGDNAGVLLRGIAREDVERGQVLAKPGSVTPHTKFKAQVYVLTKEEGGRHTPFFSNYRPQFYFRTTDVTGVIELPQGVEMVMPGDDVEMTIELITPIAIENRTKFSIREGGRTVGIGVVTKIIS